MKNAIRMCAFLTMFNPTVKKIGNAEYCLIRSQEIYCASHTLNQCLSVATNTSDAIKCIKNPLFKGEK